MHCNRALKINCSIRSSSSSSVCERGAHAAHRALVPRLYVTATSHPIPKAGRQGGRSAKRLILRIPQQQCRVTGDRTWDDQPETSRRPGAVIDVVATPLPEAPITYEDRVVGCLLASACGDVLGHPLEGLGPSLIITKCPGGNRDFYMSKAWELAGRYSGDTALLLALADSLAACGACDADDISRRQVASHQPWRGYREWDERVLEALIEGEDCRETGRKFLLGGWSLSGAARIAPVGLAYREANNMALLEAVSEAILPTHTHQSGIEAAFVQALAVKALVRAGPEAASPDALLRHLMDRCREDDMKKRIKLMLMWLPHVWKDAPPMAGSTTNWGDFFKSTEFATIIKVRRMVAEEMQLKGSQAVACALWALCCFWHSPEDAIICSTHLGGYTHSVAAMTGSVAGALHGSRWLPARWLDNLENGAGGRDDIAALGGRLAALELKP